MALCGELALELPMDRQTAVWMNEKQFCSITCLKNISLTSVSFSCMTAISKCLICITIWVKYNLLIIYCGKVIPFLLGQPIFMSYIYNTLLSHKLNLSSVVGGRCWPSHSKQSLRETAARRGCVLHLRICGHLQLSSDEYFSCWWRHSPWLAQKDICASRLFIKPLSNGILKKNSFEFPHDSFSQFPKCAYQNERNNTKLHLTMAVTGCYFTLPRLRWFK